MSEQKANKVAQGNTMNNEKKNYYNDNRMCKYVFASFKCTSWYLIAHLT